MNAQLTLTSTQIILAVGLLFGIVMAAIFIGRMFIKRNSSGLTDKYAGKEFSSPLVGRHKYPELDVLNHSNQLFLFGLAFSLALVVMAFAWTSVEQEVYIPDDALELEEDIEITPPRSAEPPPPPPPPPPPLIAEVPNEINLDE